MAKLKIGGKRNQVDVSLSTAASCAGECDTFTSFTLHLREEGEFGKEHYRFHNLILDRLEAEQLVKSLRQTLDAKRQANGRFK